MSVDPSSNSSSTSWDTPEDPGALWLEQTIFISVHLAAVAYGMHAIVFSYCIYYLRLATRPSYLLMIYVTLLFVLASVNFASNVNFNEKVWVDKRGYPGGSLGFITEQQSNWVNTLGNSVTSITGVMADGLLIWRCYIVWSKKWYIVVIPILALISSAVLTSLTVFQASRPFSSLWAGATSRFGTPYWAILCGLNIGVTLLMVSRLLWTRSRVRQTLGPEHSKIYTAISAMVVESALPYAITSFIYVVLYATGNTAQNLFLPLFAQVQCIAPELIVLRVSRGRAWNAQTATGKMGPSLPSSRHGWSKKDSNGPRSNESSTRVNVTQDGSVSMVTFAKNETRSDRSLAKKPMDAESFVDV